MYLRCIHLKHILGIVSFAGYANRAHYLLFQEDNLCEYVDRDG